MTDPKPTLMHMPGGQKLETVLLCTDGSCGRCLRCNYFQDSRTAVEEFVRVQMTLQAKIASLQALSTVQRMALDSIYQNLEDEAAKEKLGQIVNLTEEQAVAMLTPAVPAAEEVANG